MTTKEPIRGLATVALLKAMFDSGRDHIGMFSPFVLDTANSLDEDAFGAAEVQAGLKQRHGLVIPSHSLQILLRRAVRQGFLRREAGRFFRTDRLEGSVDLTDSTMRVQHDNEQLAEALIEFGEERDLSLGDTSTALGHIVSFLSDNHIAVLLNERTVGGSDDEAPTREQRVVARFVRESLESTDRRSKILRCLIEGFVLQNTLLLRDISKATRRFRELTVFLDTHCMLSALGLMGEISATATREGLHLLRGAGARLAVFEATLHEIRRILVIYVDRLGTTAGRESLRPTPLTRHLLTNQYRPSDVRQVMALIEHDVQALQIRVRGFPERITDFVLDERALTDLLTRPDEDPTAPRIRHDVDAIAAMLTIRHGHRPLSLDHARAVFCTTNGRLVRTVDSWYRAQDQEGVLPIIYQNRLTNLAWCKKPAAAPELKVHEVSAACSAALRPSRKTWDRFLAELTNLQDTGRISSEEAVAVVVSEFTDRYLGELEDAQDDLDAESLSEVVERVREQYRSEATQRVATAEARARRAESAATTAAEEQRQLQLNIQALGSRVSKIVSKVLYVLLGIAIFAGLALALPGLMAKLSRGWQIAGWILITACVILTALNLMWGWVLRSTMQGLEEWLATRISAALLNIVKKPKRDAEPAGGAGA